MQRLFDGIIEFQEAEFEAHKALFEDLGRQQRPHSLFIGCSDSRVVPNLFTQTGPGELFMVRNIANLVPPYRQTEEYVATTSAIEYAVVVLEVENIIVCGHSNCGGCQALYHPPAKAALTPHVTKWLELAAPVKEKVASLNPKTPQEREWLTEQLNVVLQLKHLMTYPFVKEKVEAGTLTLMGWYYLIETGEIYNYEADRKRFEKITKND